MSFASQLVCVHLLQHEHQIVHSSLHVRRSQEFMIDGIFRDFRDMFSCPLQNYLGLLDHTSKERLRLHQPLLKIVLGTAKTFHIDKTRSVFPNLSCREIVGRSHCICKSSLIGNASFQRDYLLLKLRENLLNSHGHSRIVKESKQPNTLTLCEIRVSRVRPQTKELQFSSCVFPTKTPCKLDKQTCPSNPSQSPAPVKQASPQVSSPRPNCPPPHNKRRATITNVAQIERYTIMVTNYDFCRGSFS